MRPSTKAGVAKRSHCGPVFTTVAVISLAIGIGADTAIFTLLDQALLPALPVRDPGQLVLLSWNGSHYGSNWEMNSTLARVAENSRSVTIHKRL
jgi:hypothetical protein